MRIRIGWRIPLGLALAALSAALYALHVSIFGDSRALSARVLGDLAFIPVQIFVVTLVVHGVISLRERRTLRYTLPMSIGAFFSEAGVPLLRQLAPFAVSADKIAELLRFTPSWTRREFRSVRRTLKRHDTDIDCARGDVPALQALLAAKRAFLLHLLARPGLLEHEPFTDLLWAAQHLADELAARQDVAHLAPSDARHLAGDIRRCYRLLLAEWLAYNQHLQAEYPHLFSLSIRMNPLNPDARPEVT